MWVKTAVILIISDILIAPPIFATSPTTTHNGTPSAVLYIHVRERWDKHDGQRIDWRKPIADAIVTPCTQENRAAQLYEQLWPGMTEHMFYPHIVHMWITLAKCA